MPANRGRAVYVLVADGRNHGRATAMREGSVEAAHDSCYRRGRGCGRGGRRRRDPAPSAPTSPLIGADIGSRFCGDYSGLGRVPLMSVKLYAVAASYEVTSVP